MIFAIELFAIAPLFAHLRTRLRRPHDQLRQNRYTLRQNGNRRLDTDGVRSFNELSSGVPVALTGQEGIRCGSPVRRRSKSGAAPATVGGESFSEVPLGFAVQSLGRLRRAMTRKPGDLPERSHPSVVRGRAFGADFRCGDESNCHTGGGRHG